jgi:hypothetical protein
MPTRDDKPTRRRRMGGDVCAIFVHAGAGYHSVQNEKIHLQACEEYVSGSGHSEHSNLSIADHD